MTARQLSLIVGLLMLVGVFAPQTPVSVAWPWPGIGVPVGPKRVLIVRETLNSDLNGVMVSLRNDPYMAKHTADFLDLDAKTKDGPAPAVVAFRAAHPNVTPPALLIAVPNGRTVYCESLPAKPTAAGIIATIKASGGGE